MAPELIHTAFGLAAYMVGFAVFRRQRGRHDFLSGAERWSLVAAAVVGAAVGAKVLHWLANPSMWPRYLEHPVLLAAGKTLVGGLLGGWALVEVGKKMLGISQRTGDLYVLPLIAGICVGRLGCFFAGLADRTYGVATSLPWGVDFGDGVPRHPTQLYEVLFLLVLTPVLMRRPASGEGWRFRAFMFAYLAFRLGVDALKPYERLAGLNPIQWACLFVLIYLARELVPLCRWLLGSKSAPVDTPAPEV